MMGTKVDNRSLNRPRGPKSADVEVVDKGGLASTTYFTCREHLWKMVQLVEDMMNGTSFEEDPITFLPVDFGQSHAGNKRKRKLAKLQPPCYVTSVVTNPAPALDYMYKKYSYKNSITNIWGHGVCKLSPRESEHAVHEYAMVLGVGPACPDGSTALIRYLSTTTTIEIPRSQISTYSGLDHDQEVIELVNQDASFLLLQNKPENIDEKYWDQRYRIFSRFDLGIKLDEESWYSATFESIGDYIAEACILASKTKINPSSLSSIWDCCSGCGGNTIPFCRRGIYVTAIDIDEQKLRYLR